MTVRACSIVLVLGVSLLPVRAASPKDVIAKGLALEGVGLGTTLVVAKSRLGAPAEEVAHPLAPDAEMGMGPRMTVRYADIVLEMCKPPGSADFHVWRMTVTGPSRVLTKGVRVGMARQGVIEALGAPAATSRTDDRTEVLQYLFQENDGRYWVKVKDGAVTEIGMTAA